MSHYGSDNRFGDKSAYRSNGLPSGFGRGPTSSYGGEALGSNLRSIQV